MENNFVVANDIVNQLKERQLISLDEDTLVSKIANGTIKENDWKLIFEQQILNKVQITEDEVI